MHTTMFTIRLGVMGLARGFMFGLMLGTHTQNHWVRRRQRLTEDRIVISKRQKEIILTKNEYIKELECLVNKLQEKGD